MNEKKLRLIHTVCGIVVSATLIVSAICLIVSAYTIYNSGDKPYTPKSISAEYAKIAIPLWITDFAVLAGIILNVALPLPKKREKSASDPFVKLRILQKKLGDNCTHDGILRQRSIRKVARTVCALLCAIAFIPSIIILCDYDSFTVSKGNEVVELPQKEFLLLYKLLSYPGKIFTRIQLMDEIWGADSETRWETVTVHIARLRKRFENWNEFQIESVRSLGYKAVKNV